MDDASDPKPELLIKAILSVEVLNIFFPWLGHSLILDTRHSPEAPPAVLLEPMVGSAEARLRSFAHLRPQFAIPDRLAVAPWLGSMRAFAETGVFGAIVERLHTLGYPERAVDAERAFRRLVRLERAALRGIIAGETSTALWERGA